MQPAAVQIVFIAVLRQIGIHLRDALRLRVIGAMVHDLYAQSLVDRQKFRGRAVGFLLFGRRLHSPFKVRPRDKVRQPDNGKPAESGFICIAAALLPEALQRRHNIFKKALDPVIGFIAHFQRIGHGIQNADRLLVGAARLIWVAFSADGDIVRFRNGNNLRSAFRHVEFLIFLFIIKCQLKNLHFCANLLSTAKRDILSYHAVIHLSRKRICSFVWNQCSPSGMTVSAAPMRPVKANMVSREVRSSCAP